MSDPRQLAREGVEFLRRGEPARAREAFEAMLAGGVRDHSISVALAIACRALGDTAAAQSAIDRALESAPRDARALLLKADLLADAGDPRAAAPFYLEAVKIAEAQGDAAGVPLAEVQRARAACEAVGRAIEAGVRDALGSVEAGSRFTQSLDLLFGHRRPYFQQPRYYFFPGLAQIQFFPRETFPWLEAWSVPRLTFAPSWRVCSQRTPARFSPMCKATPRGLGARRMAWSTTRTGALFTSGRMARR
jgi:tetratricopeptide (TPR) repeat protein